MKKNERINQTDPAKISDAEILKQTAEYVGLSGLMAAAEFFALSQMVNLGDFSRSLPGYAVGMGLLLANHFPVKKIVLRK